MCCLLPAWRNQQTLGWVPNQGYWDGGIKGNTKIWRGNQTFLNSRAHKETLVTISMLQRKKNNQPPTKNHQPPFTSTAAKCGGLKQSNLWNAHYLKSSWLPYVHTFPKPYPRVGKTWKTFHAIFIILDTGVENLMSNGWIPVQRTNSENDDTLQKSEDIKSDRALSDELTYRKDFGVTPGFLGHASGHPSLSAPFHPCLWMHAVAEYTLVSDGFYPLETRGRWIRVQITQPQVSLETWAVRHSQIWQPGTNRPSLTCCEAVPVSLGISLGLVFF